ncbi:beta-ketoacyl-ACP synthase [Campylobacter sp. RM9344]|uniref:Beta-ketoacyl-ACP synthase n=1 Tax=Campylobacter californiensis TaxID=1032243 RepID=A0AAW3ZU89_9BACT|nr:MULTISPECIES: multiheme c-type cytochrome [unclassified Campylobacter]MBE2984709.1 beta-ketoacyl-ACP synthase [Campylobacter sp. RM6883]MBE2986899.1 beta-ketoacyl-ACP synthase [Campylobacter sp. RM12919]MBE2987813.1 beta-ketoacyl-ACP synthase [Campylobacter sp. RM12920]MBE2994625.1 beta-ketoacyl-ACP synthase [Campylobacter sp. RM6913]MBE3029151.1 beta-ketoacyl-ACP synthase [Campylobacter sp. RM9344]
MFKKVAILLAFVASVAFANTDANQSSDVKINLVKNIKVNHKMTKESKACVECHAEKTPGVVADWKESRHAHVGVSCMDCHAVNADNPMASVEVHPKGSDTHVSMLVSPKTCAKCHEDAYKEYTQSGHARGGMQMYANPAMVKLMYHYEGADHPEFKMSPDITGCAQCHGSIIKLDANHKPTPETYPNYGIANVYPDGSVGGCKSCHTMHKFSIAEARKPAACASCHLGPDHPDIEIFNNSKHGHIYNAEGHTWKYDAAPDTWDVPDFRAPTCAACHMSGVGETSMTHNVSKRLKWNLWAPRTELRTGGYDKAVETFEKTGKINVGTPLAGHPEGPEAARAEMKQVCKACHTTHNTENFFIMADKHIQLYNVYYDEAKKMLDDLKAKNLLLDDMWADEFQDVFYHLWHHEGRRMRQGAAMNAPDYAHWHGVFEVKNDIRKLRKIYKERIETGKVH